MGSEMCIRDSNYPMLEKEKWDVDMDKVQKEADEAIQKYTEVLKELENE